jgi:DNA-binding LacI/PurR family transcriptional regulator
MTVCTNDLALADLGEHRLPAVIADAFGDVEALVAEMVELEHERIALAAVDARSLAKERHEL